MIFMGNLTKDSESESVNNCNDVNLNKNQEQFRYLSMPKFSKKDLVIFTKTLEDYTVINLMNHTSLYILTPHTLYA
jgi:hypothetical protein